MRSKIILCMAYKVEGITASLLTRPGMASDIRAAKCSGKFLEPDATGLYSPSMAQISLFRPSGPEIADNQTEH